MGGGNRKRKRKKGTGYERWERHAMKSEGELSWKSTGACRARRGDLAR